MLLLFNIVFLITKNFKNRKFYPGKNKLKNMLQREMEHYDPKMGLSNELKIFLTKGIEKTKNLIILQRELENITEHKQKIKAEVLPYVLNKIESYQKKTEYEQAYYAHVISCFDYGKEKYDEKFYQRFLEFLDSKSLYVFSNAMNAIYKFSDPYLLSVSIQKVNERNGFYHSKLFVDGLLEFKGDVDILHSLMIEKFYQYSTLIQESLLNYFRLKDANVDEFCLDILKERKVNDEALYSAMRYFAKHPNEEAKTIFIDILKNSESFWVEQLLAIQALKSYDEPLVKNVIKEKITSKNWHVRINSISYLHYHILSKSEIFHILSLKDQYTNEALLYFYKDDKEISEYIVEIINMLNAEENETQEINSPVSPAF